MAQPWPLADNLVIACAYAAITVAIALPVIQAAHLHNHRRRPGPDPRVPRTCASSSSVPPRGELDRAECRLGDLLAEQHSPA